MPIRSSGRPSQPPAERWHDGLDPLTQVLHDLRLVDSFYCRSELRAPWGLDIPDRHYASFHFIAAGAAWLRRAGEPPLELAAGDLVLLPRGRAHVLADAPRGPAKPVDRFSHERIAANAVVIRGGGAGAPSLVVCGGVRFEHAAVNPLLELMPDVLHVRGGAGGEQVLRLALAAMGEEALSPRPGSPTMMTRFGDILVMQAVRQWLDRAPEGRTGWLGALRDPQVGIALALIHRRPEEPWTVATLAAAARASRSVFAERFTALVGVSPMQYLTRWRMNLACSLLRDEGLGLGEVATRLGYDSEPAFSRAFKRHVGVAPGAHRRSAAPAGPPRPAAQSAAQLA